MSSVREQRYVGEVRGAAGWGIGLDAPAQAIDVTPQARAHPRGVIRDFFERDGGLMFLRAGLAIYVP
jgi:hypothetical protein